MINQAQTTEVLVVGAGVAGLAAARLLAEQGLRVVVLEAREHAGGRLMTLHPEHASVPVELGAEFIHGRPPELLALLQEAGLAIYEGEGEEFCYAQQRLGGCADTSALDVLEDLRQDEDVAFDAWLAERDLPEAVRARVRGYVEGFNAADASRIGTAGLARQQAAEDAIEGQRVARVEAGYDALAMHMQERTEAAGAVIELGAPVLAVNWHAGASDTLRRQAAAGHLGRLPASPSDTVRAQVGSVTIETRSGKRYRAEQAIFAVPLGVLQAGEISFDPQPPNFAALGHLAMGAVARLVLCFEEAFWAPNMRFLFAQDQLPGVWWTTAPRSSAVLTAWIGGPRALLIPNPEELLAQALSTLEQMYQFTAGSLRGKLISWHLHDWQQDPYSRGAYSYPLVGGVAAAEALATPVDGTLFFAGEHTDTSGHPGTVHGALRSGLRAGAQVLAARRQSY